MKKFLSLLLTFVMLFSMTMPAMAAENTQTIYFENTENWEVVNAFYWIEGSGENLNNWPGTALTHIEDSIWSIAVPTSADNIIFNNGSGTQTDDLTIPTDGKNLYNYDTGTWSTYGSTGGSTVTGQTSGDVTASYTPTAGITGVSITVDGTTYTEGNVTIKPDSTVTLTVTGTNLQNGTEDNCVLYASGGGIAINSGWFKFSEDGTTATMSLSSSEFSRSSNHEIVYYNNYTAGADRTENSTGIYVTYHDGTTPTYTVDIASNITNGTITSDKTTAAKGETVILTITPERGYELDKLTVNGTDVTADVANNEYSFSMGEENVEITATFKAITYDVNIGTVTGGSVTVDKAKAAAGETVTVSVEAVAGYAYKVNSLKVINDTTNEEVEVNEDAKTFVMPASSVTVTAEFEKLTTTSAEITWGSLSFTYDDTVAEDMGEEIGWTCAEGTNTITVENTGETTFTAQPIYTAETDYSEIEGRFYDSEDAEQGRTIGLALNKEQSHTFWLRLLGKPEKAIPAGTKIGTVTIEIVEGSPE